MRKLSSMIYNKDQECQIWHPNWVRLAPNGTNLGFFKINFRDKWDIYLGLLRSVLVQSKLLLSESE